MYQIQEGGKHATLYTMMITAFGHVARVRDDGTTVLARITIGTYRLKRSDRFQLFQCWKTLSRACILLRKNLRRRPMPRDTGLAHHLLQVHGHS